MSDKNNTLALAAGIGLIAGLRSMAAPALVSHHLSQRSRGRAPGLLASSRTAAVLKLLAAGEMVGDKTPFIPNRTDPPALAGRALSGALSGAALAGARGGSPLGAALIGSTAAVGSTFLAYNLRREAGRRSGIPDFLLGLVEDVVVLTAGSNITAAFLV